jgi:hypothetical protein
VSGVDIHSNGPRTAYETTFVPKLKSILLKIMLEERIINCFGSWF